MKIKKITVADIPPIKNFMAGDLKDLIVIAGPNGVGKTRLVDAMLRYFKTPKSNNRGKHSTNPSFIIEATDAFERETWGQQELDTTIPEEAETLQSFLQGRRTRRNLRNSVLNYESNRWVRQQNSSASKHNRRDPWEEGIPSKLTLGGLGDRWDDTQNAIFRKLEYERTSLGDRALQMWNEGHESMPLEFDDPTTPFTEAFFNLLGPKVLEKPTLDFRKLMYVEGEKRLDIESLSSGEIEVFRIVIDFVLREPSHCIVFFDEPELHLHPELLYRLITTLRSVGESNQFILATHSAELISSSMHESVIFLTPPKADGGNQAVKIEPAGDVAEALHQLGQSVGIVSLGKKIVLIEGSDGSLDKKTYGQITKDKFPDLVLLPSGRKNTLSSFETIASEVLEKSLWGIQFFMLADRDVNEGTQLSETDHFRMLSRYHLENYFLDAEILCQCFADREDEDSWLQSSEEIDIRLRKIAQNHFNHSVKIVVAKRIRDATGRVNLNPNDIHNMDRRALVHAFSQKAADETERIAGALDKANVEKLANDTYRRFQSLLDNPSNDWKNEFPGKPIFSDFCSVAKEQQHRLINLYIQKSRDAESNPFQEIIDILSSFAQA